VVRNFYSLVVKIKTGSLPESFYLHRFLDGMRNARNLKSLLIWILFCGWGPSGFAADQLKQDRMGGPQCTHGHPPHREVY
jgi:hypothetical protein